MIWNLSLQSIKHHHSQHHYSSPSSLGKHFYGKSHGIIKIDVRLGIMPCHSSDQDVVKRWKLFFFHQIMIL